MTRQSLEKYQVLAYVAAILLGLSVGLAFPQSTALLDALLWPLLGFLLYATFTQVPFAQLPRAFASPAFFAAAILGNFLLIPILVWGLLFLLPADPAIQLGVLLVLLVPCTDWFITFTHLGGGDTHRAIAFSPLSLLLQILLLPLYLWLMIGAEFSLALATSDVLAAFAGLIVVPLIGAWLTELWVQKRPARRPVIEGLAWLPVPLLAAVLFIVALSQVQHIWGSMGLLASLLLVYLLFLGAAPVLAKLLTTLFQLPPRQGRVLAFSFGTRNSFVVLPLALALPPLYEGAVLAIVFQTLVELFGMVLFLWCIPRYGFPIPSQDQSKAKRP